MKIKQLVLALAAGAPFFFGAAGAFVGFLAFRFRVAGVYFAILTIAVAEFARVGFDHLAFTSGSSGLFLPVAQYTPGWSRRLADDPPTQWVPLPFTFQFPLRLYVQANWFWVKLRGAARLAVWVGPLAK